MAFSKAIALDHLSRAHTQNRLAHAYLIAGPAGSGKRALVGEIAALLNATTAGRTDPLLHPNVHIAEPESKSRRIVVDQIRSLERELQMRSSDGSRKLAVIFEADRMVTAASNAFLKTLEEPPANSVILLTTAFMEMLLDTILSRCIPVMLKPPATREVSPHEERLLAALERFFNQREAGVADVYRLVRQFQDLLLESREEIQAEHAAEIKKEEAHYRQATDGAWLESREEYFKALTEARYVESRLELVDVLTRWWADVLRQKEGFERLDLPSHAQMTARLAGDFTAVQLLDRVAAIDDLREHLGRNIQELLAIETAFLRAFLRQGE